MRPPRPPRRDDTIGNAMRYGLTPYRGAEPSKNVWRRIEAELEPAPPVRRRASISFSGTAALSVCIMVVLAVTGLGAELNSSNGVWTSYGEPVGYRLSDIDSAVAKRAAAPGPWDAIMPPPAVADARPSDPREAYNRALWQAEAPSRAAATDGEGIAIEPMPYPFLRQ
jgi:hypothetical protein